MSRRTMRAMKRRVAAGIVVLFAAVAFLAIRAPAGTRSLRVFDPDRTADLEVDMWQAYYKKANTRLFADLVTLLHDQNRYSWAMATAAGFHLARAAATFATSTGDY